MIHPLAKPVALALLAAALAGCGTEDPESAAPTRKAEARAFADAPPPIADLHEQANQLLDGGPDAFKDELAKLNGIPVVVNKWASWCAPCRSEFPLFQRQALKHATEVAFIGVNSNDNEQNASDFLADYRVPYPSFNDPDSAIAHEFRGNIAFPTTAFYDSDGELVYVKQGEFGSERDLADDIERYAR